MLEIANNWLWGKLLIGLLIGIGLKFTLASNWLQFRHFGQMFRVLKQGSDSSSDTDTNSDSGTATGLNRPLTEKSSRAGVSSFQALALTVAGRVGAGNIAGVAVAISFGGPGAIFWMWVIGIIGMATSFFECSLAQVYKQVDRQGNFRGGPAFYMHKGLNRRWMGIIYSCLLAASVGIALIALQSFTVASTFAESFSWPPIYTGLLLASLTGLVIFGGVRRIAEVAQWIVPLMAVGYCVLGLLVIAINVEKIPATLWLIVSSALGLEQAVSGGVGAAIMMGVRRGLFSNEAGLGHAANVAAIASVKHPAAQGLAQSLSVFIDTLILCTVTALIILLSDTYLIGTESQGIALTQLALAEHIGEWSGIFVSLALGLFAFTTMLYLYYLGENGLSFFSAQNKSTLTGYRILILLQIVWGAGQQLDTIFALADLAIAILAVGNLIALGLLSRTGMRVFEDYQQQLAQGVLEPKFDPEQFSDLNLDKSAWK